MSLNDCKNCQRCGKPIFHGNGAVISIHNITMDDVNSFRICDDCCSELLNVFKKEDNKNVECI